MKLLKFQGHSDDTFACSGPGINVDYDNCASGKPITMLVESGDDAVLVVGQYAPGHAGGWLIGIAPWDPDHNDTPVPEWPMRLGRSDADYSPGLEIEAPDGVTVTLLGVKQDDEDE